MSRTSVIIVAGVALIALIAVIALSRPPDTAHTASPAPSISGQPTTSAPTTSESIQPTPPPTSTVLLTFEGSGSKSSEPFIASGDSVALAYTFDCSALGTSGNFTESFYDTNALVLDTVKEFAKSGTRTTVVYIANTALPYHLEVNSQCAWTIKVTGTP